MSIRFWCAASGLSAHECCTSGSCLSLIVAGRSDLDPAPRSLLLTLAIAALPRQKNSWHQGLWPEKPDGRNARPFDEIAPLWNSRDPCLFPLAFPVKSAYA